MQPEYYQDLDVVEEDFVQDIYDPQVKFSESVLNLENETFKQMNLLDPSGSIEKQPNQASIQVSNEKNKCAICSQKFTFLIPQKQWFQCCGFFSHFCQNLICEKHAKKKRKDPIDNIFKRICDFCEEDLLQILISGDFVTQKDKLEKQLLDAESLSQEIVIILKEKEQGFDDDLKQLHNQLGGSKQQRDTILRLNLNNSEQIPKLAEQIDSLKDQSLSIQQKILYLEQTLYIKGHHQISKQDFYSHQQKSEQMMNKNISELEAEIAKVQDFQAQNLKREQLRQQIQSELQTYKNTNSVSDNQSLIHMYITKGHQDTSPTPPRQNDRGLSKKSFERNKKIPHEKACLICLIF